MLPILRFSGNFLFFFNFSDTQFYNSGPKTVATHVGITRTTKEMLKGARHARTNQMYLHIVQCTLIMDAMLEATFISTMETAGKMFFGDVPHLSKKIQQNAAFAPFQMKKALRPSSAFVTNSVLAKLIVTQIHIFNRTYQPMASGRPVKSAASSSTRRTTLWVNISQNLRRKILKWPKWPR